MKAYEKFKNDEITVEDLLSSISGIFKDFGEVKTKEDVKTLCEELGMSERELAFFFEKRVFAVENPNCHKCRYSRNVPGNTHIACSNNLSIVEADEHGIRMGWANHPFIVKQLFGISMNSDLFCNFDPCWLRLCIGFSPKSDTK